MEPHDLNDLDRRLRAVRPRTAEVRADAFDGALLSRVREQPDEPGRHRAPVPRAVALPVAAGVTFAAAGVVMFAGGPDDVGGPSSAHAISQQTLRWLDPPAGTVLHVRSVETMNALATTREFWQSADDPSKERTVVDGPGDKDYEISGDVLYDVAGDTIYDVPLQPDDGVKHRDPAAGGDKPAVAKARDDKKADVLKAKAGGPAKRVAPAQSGSAPVDGGKGPDAPVGDPVVAKVRMLLQDGQMDVVGRETHDGAETWKITLRETKGRQPWTLWVDAGDGKPVELIDPGRAPGDPVQTIRWSAYDVLPKSDASEAALTIQTAHPGAKVSHDQDAAAAARNRLLSKADD